MIITTKQNKAKQKISNNNNIIKIITMMIAMIVLMFKITTVITIKIKVIPKQKHNF